jgi:hypothetical protein
MARSSAVYFCKRSKVGQVNHFEHLNSRSCFHAAVFIRHDDFFILESDYAKESLMIEGCSGALCMFDIVCLYSSVLIFAMLLTYCNW